eukprot:CAMPEP_0174292994 /NCGR_PEP_ID=MMETSP0809-20121228/37167_1 /TAXON_ID=73025 ORGANISM="Eutreptiella gymnastica-like, Strain CCMP1594" /NCGR_SAMPLE_ID=MMETSP0809 /ASSEMBLY_ACC=CAM_ASM_000658 /LENGTH=68 /DNA_ID=CAMNT_0015393467 /DNA_START=1106 /DNA_END=1312 /DNA_ORIENTATION=-
MDIGSELVSKKIGIDDVRIACGGTRAPEARNNGGTSPTRCGPAAYWSPGLQAGDWGVCQGMPVPTAVE